MAKRVYFIAHGGIVQGVGFRMYTRARARVHGVSGWCRNTRDNNVEGEAQGREEVVEEFLKDVAEGPRLATVAYVSREEREVVDGEASFVIRD
ncbi:hypothetical protein CDD81_2150 [Ophiocordyceps australis]|uniref:acylphosphatase n=1 Tax=Ophiocordyceps australis TaxID=1399860 RepID=A0A2C5XZC6_9HYPO|nr:hypothetical protein CDD81_2150 [Ophiocordyceps australis]